MPNKLRSLLFAARRLFAVKKIAAESPLRSELYGPEQMQNYGKSLAESHTLSVGRMRCDRLLGRLEENETLLENARQALAAAALKKRRMMPAADWLLDNFYLVEDHIRISKRDLPRGYSRELPRLADSVPAGIPRVYDIALGRISHGDGLVDPESLPLFLESYQSVHVLTLGELWAIPIMLRLALIENLRRVAVRILEEMHIQRKADYWADRMISRATSDPTSLILIIADMARSDPPMVSAFVAEFAYRLQSRGQVMELPLAWIEQQLTEKNSSIEILVQAEMQQQAADQVSVSNTIRSLRSLTAKDWKEFVESNSPVEKKLREDPSRYYGKMDFMTRDRYRHVVEKTAKRNGLSEEAVSACVVRLADERFLTDGDGAREAHVGYYLVDKGYPLLLRTLSLKVSAGAWIRNAVKRNSFALYSGIIILSSLLSTVGFAISPAGVAVPVEVILAVCLLICLCGFYLAVVNWMVMFFATPHALPRMDFTDGIPAECRTIVVVPSMLSSIRHIDNLVESLEVRFLANRDDNLFFGLLTDFTDADHQDMADDRSLADYAKTEMEKLNALYGDISTDRFFLFHRGRSWNDGERSWMGRERKRGKLADLNALISGGKTGPFSLIVGRVEPLSTVKYVITLDTDTQLPRDSARQLTATMAHPLNAARYDPESGIISDGYGILQPRIAASLSGSELSVYARMSGSDPGLDPYTRAVSDVYQDLFGEGSFIGKGIYDVAAFELVLKDRFPDNRILSHDLLEGCYVRSGLVSDVSLIEGAPVSYHADVDRRRRWMRGDWQIMQWLLPSVPSLGGSKRKNPLSPLSRWKILDNLRRTLSAPSQAALLVLGWTVLPLPMLWTLIVAGVILIPPLIASLERLIRKPDDTPIKAHLRYSLRALPTGFGPPVISLSFLPYEAYYSLRTLLQVQWRMFASCRNLLEWKASEEHCRHDRSSLLYSAQKMWVGPVCSLGLTVLLSLINPGALVSAVPFLALWLVSPGIAWWLGKPLREPVEATSAGQNAYLRRIARKTWAFFETFVTAEENWLPPDNFQEVPIGKVAHRTSPTNMGIALLANLTARDLGYLTDGCLIERTVMALDTMSRLERHRNHFYNWYDTITLQPLPPRYVSTVDSGNLAAHLLTLRSGLASLSVGPFGGKALWDGINDTVVILTDIYENRVPAALIRLRVHLEPLRVDAPQTGFAMWLNLGTICGLVEELNKTSVGGKRQNTGKWLNALQIQCQEALMELEYLMPWVTTSRHCEKTIDGLSLAPCLRDLIAQEAELILTLEGRMNAENGVSEKQYLSDFLALVREGHANGERRIASAQAAVIRLDEMAWMDFSFLYNEHRHLFTIGYNVDSRRIDSGSYDLLASEARLVSFVAIAQGQISQENWFYLGRPLNDAGGDTLLISWSGSMFEYLMPLLVMPVFVRTLLAQTCQSVVRRQIDYGKLRGVPWGISESGYNSLDASVNYQYHAFGIPGLGLRRGLADDLVIAPYATALALLVSPVKACLNLQRMSDEGFEGDYGFYEAIDYTKSRVPADQKYAIVRSFMAHHQGMSLIALASCLLDGPMQKRFQAIPAVKATVLLLEEKIPRVSTAQVRAMEIPERLKPVPSAGNGARIYKTFNTPEPQVQLLSNGNYHVMVNNSGSGYSRWRNLAVTRWVEDQTCDARGTFLYIRDAITGNVWSNTYQPTLAVPDGYEVIFSEGRAEYRRRDHDIETYTEIVVSPEDDIELRRVRLTNRSRFVRRLEVTSYGEVVLAAAESDAAHPCFSNLFVETEIIGDKRAILYKRRSRSPEEDFPVLFHLALVRDREASEVSFESDRMKFIGRLNNASLPAALGADGILSGGQGSVLDPIFSIRHGIGIGPDESVVIDIITGIAGDRDGAVQLVEKYQGKIFANRAFELSRTHSQILLGQIKATETDAHLYNRLGGSVLYANRRLRADESFCASNRRGQSGLWGYSISGDLPIALVTIKDSANIGLVQQMIQAHAYWHQKGLNVDLVIWNEEFGSYRQQLHEQVASLITATGQAVNAERPGGIFVRYSDQISAEDRTLFLAVARIVLLDGQGNLEVQLARQVSAEKPMPRLIPSRSFRQRYPRSELPGRTLVLENGLGGFTPDGKEYVITTSGKARTPAPWVNVISNKGFGTVVSESGMAYTWSGNAHEFRLTPWHNDPVCDTGGEAMYVRDEDSGLYWSPAPLPAGGNEPYVTRHGFGYSAFEHVEFGIHTELQVFVDVKEPVKFMRLTVRNESGKARTLSATAYAELVLGTQRASSAMHVITEIDKDTGAVFAKNWFNADFAGRTVFLDAVGEDKSVTADRTEFLGRNGTMAAPDAMNRMRLSGKTGSSLDPCAAVRVSIDLADRQETVVVFMMGAAADSEQASVLLGRFQSPDASAAALRAVNEYWKRALSTIQVETPDRSLDILANGWLVYQTLSSRLWGRSGFYQSGGAYGFRDQIQDAMALAPVHPEIVREHLLFCAAHQFVEGDVQHWWHPPTGRGSRTHCSDDYLWLPAALIRYLAVTGDAAILDEAVPFIEGRPVKLDEESYYDLPNIASETATLYEHCVRAIKRSSARGEHGLPLIGSGDWNDGMNRVGSEGKGESVWLAFFLYAVLTDFAGIARTHNDGLFADYCSSAAAKLAVDIEASGWDGAWYRRAYFDDGTALGSSANAECRIDSIAQSWAVLSHAVPKERGAQAMRALDENLVRRGQNLVLLLDPPFDGALPNPGYIRGYVPGVRENGGQYTHAAIWAAMAFAAQGDAERAWELCLMINPLKHSDTAEKEAVYKVEPYVMSADVYSVAPHTGRGGWTWYTGSAGWMYRLITESLMGLIVEGDTLRFAPCLPHDWNSCWVHYRYKETAYHIEYLQIPGKPGGTQLLVDGEVQRDPLLHLVDDRQDHQIKVAFTKDES